MKHYGDITKINGAEIELVHVITGGSPCQDLSVAGGRSGLAGERSGLFMEQVRIVKEQRNESIRQLRMRRANVDLRLVQPRYMVWENVPGAFSSNKGEDFRCVLEEICRIADQTANVPMPEKGKWSTSGCIVGDGWSVAWRVHDAQFWGVPQRRKRISLVADFAGQTAPEILFERKSVSGDIEQSGETGQGASDAAETGFDTAVSFRERAGCAGGGKGILIQNERTGALSTQNSQAVLKYDNQPTLLESNQNHATVSETGVCSTLPASMGMGGGYVPMVAGTLDASYYKGCGERAGVEREILCTEEKGSSWDGTQVAPTLTANNANGAQRMPDKDNFNAVMVFEPGSASRVGGHIYEDDKSGTIRANAGDNQQAVVYSTQACGDRDNPSQSFMEETAYTIPSNPMSDRGQAVLAIDRASFNQGKNAQYDFSVQEELAQTLVAKGPGGVMTRSEHYAQETTKE